MCSRNADISKGKILTVVSQRLSGNYHTLNICKQCFKLLHFYRLSTVNLCLYDSILLELYRLCRDLWANYLSGNIPPEWANTTLELL